MFTLGGAALAISLIRILVFRIPESPRHLLAVNRDSAAVEAVNFIARANGKAEPLTFSMVSQIDTDLGVANVDTRRAQGDSPAITSIFKSSLADFRMRNFKALFATRKLIQHTTVLWTIWLSIGVAFPLYFNFLPIYLSQRFSSDSSLDTTYRSYCIQSAVGLIGPLLAAWLVQTWLGRRYVLAAGSIITGVFLFVYTTARTPASNLAFSSVSSFVANIGKCRADIFPIMRKSLC